MSVITAGARDDGASWRKSASLAYGAGGLAYGLILLLLLVMAAGYNFLGGGETGATVVGWLSIGLLAILGLPILLLLLAAIVLSLLALRVRRDGWLMLYALSIVLALLLPAALFFPSSAVGVNSGLWDLPGEVVGVYFLVTNVVPILLILRWFLRARRAA